jgi:hypothetical protein
MTKNNLSWTFNEINRTTYWYIIALSIVIWISIWWIFTKQYWLSFIVILISGLYYFTETDSEEKIEVSLEDKWVYISKTLYNYKDIDFFQFINNKNRLFLLRLHLNKKGAKFIDVRIDENIKTDVEQKLLNIIEKYEDEELSFIEKSIFYLKL